MDESFPFTPAEDASPADWIIDRLQGFGESVLSIVPAGFEAYARIFHPMYRYVGEKRVPVSWAEIAEANGHTAHRQMQFPSVIGYSYYQQQSSPADIWDEMTNEGHLPKRLARPLWQSLKKHTTTPESCWFAVWEGFGSFGALEPTVFAAPSFEIPGRRLYLFSASVEAAESSLCEVDDYQSANLWWPNDRAWCVATEIDFMTTYVGGSLGAINDILTCKDLETFRVQPSDGVQWASDTVNPKPKGGW